MIGYVSCPYDGEALPVSLRLLGDPPTFDLRLSPVFVEHMNGAHGAQLLPVEVWPPAEPTE